MSLIVKTMPLHKAVDEKITISLVAARHKNKLVFVRRRGFNTWEMPGGHREGSESVLDCAKRELYEETGATQYRIVPVCAYSVNDNGSMLYGVLFVAEIASFGDLPESEIGEVRLFDTVPTELTFPLIQAKLSVISLPHELCGGMGKDISIRRAQYIDVADICEIYRPEFVSTGDEDTDEIIKLEQDFSMRTTEHLLRTTIEKAGHHVLIAYDGIRPIGVCEIRLLSRAGGHEEGYDGGDIKALTVLPSHRRCGIGTHMTDCAVDFLKSIGCSYAVVWIPAADDELCGIAKAQGFKPDGVREMTDHGMRLRYRRSLVG
ncbi:MAG: GNAT family N-acetyltransferase [Clostridia bacterium]|nr:GNAT family N-acetyltransferase [Clostridia bacterium]